MDLPEHIWYLLAQRHMLIAAEVPASCPDQRAWIGIYPAPDITDGLTIRYFEIKRDLIDHDYDIGEDDLLNRETIDVRTQDELVTWYVVGCMT